MNMQKLFYKLNNVGICYKHSSLFHSHSECIWALKDISFSIYQGETIGIIGRNGVGKTTLLRLLANIISCDTGSFECNAKKISLLSLGAGFDNYLTGKENIGFNGRLLGISADKLKESYDAIVELSGIGSAINMPVRTYSTGMKSRLGFAIAYFAAPEVLLLDENLGVGDIRFQKMSSHLIKEKLQQPQQTAVLVSHSIAMIREICSRVIWIEDGKVMADGDVIQVTGDYLKNAKN